MVAAILTAIVVVLAAGFGIFLLFNRRSDAAKRPEPRDTMTTIGAETPLNTREGFSMRSAAGSHQNASQSLIDRMRPRFLAVYVLIAGVFGSLATRLWTIQVLSHEQYELASDKNQLTSIKMPAPRGRIFDTEGVVMVDNRSAASVLADAEVINDRGVLMRLSVLLGIPYGVVRQKVLDASSGAQAQREITSKPTARDIAFIAEHPDAFPGVSVEERSHRIYPYGALAGQVLGYTGSISQDELDSVPEGSDYQSGDEVGKSGVEAAYDSILAGAHGERIVVTDAQGVVQALRSETPASQGNDLYLTLSAKVQGLAEQRLKERIAPDGVIGEGRGISGACVAMEVDTGNVIAMASFPSFNPANFVGGISQQDWDRYNDPMLQAPLVNRCIAGRYPAASTFKAFSGISALHYGFADESRTWECTGEWTGFGEDYPQNCWQLSGHGYIDFRTGIVVSCDVVFYEIAKSFYYAGESLGYDAMQKFIMKFGFGSVTGIELSGEDPGVVPTPEWKAEAYRDAPEEAQWRPGDMSNMAIGQGNVLITPLQLARAYGAIATGKLATPNLLKEVRNSVGETVITHTPELVELDGVSEEELEIIRDGLRGVATEGGSVVKVLNEYDTYECCCKTGTGEKANHDGYAWFAMYAPHDAPKYVVTCVVEEGGSGAAIAAPIAAEVMDACIRLGAGELDMGVYAQSEITEAVEYIGTGDGRVD